MVHIKLVAFVVFTTGEALAKLIRFESNRSVTGTVPNTSEPVFVTAMAKTTVSPQKAGRFVGLTIVLEMAAEAFNTETIAFVVCPATPTLFLATTAEVTILVATPVVVFTDVKSDVTATNPHADTGPMFDHVKLPDGSTTLGEG